MPSIVLPNQGSGTPGAADVDPMEEAKDEKDNENEDEKEEGEEEDEQDDDKEEEKRKADGAEEPPAFGVEGDGGDSSVLEAAKEEVGWRKAVLGVVFLIMRDIACWHCQGG